MILHASARLRALQRFTVAAALAALALAGLGSPAAHASGPRFSDVPSGHQFHDEISWLASTRVTTGYADGTFRPRDAVSREAFAAFLYRLTGSPQVTLPSRSPFRDVPATAQFYKEIVWLSQEGITTGWADGTFRPRDSISREAVAAFLYRLSGKPAFSAPSRSPFRDMSRSAKFYREVTWLASTRITTGWADGTFRPRSNVSREAIAAFLHRGSSGLHGRADTLHAVGGDVFPGVYVSSPADPHASPGYCRYERHKPPQGQPYDHLFESTYPGRTIAVIQPTDLEFRWSNCVDWTPLRATSPGATTFGDGTHAVGYHLRPGTYSAPGGDECEWRYWDGAIDWDARVGWERRARGEQRLTLATGHYVLTEACGTWTRIGN